MTAYALTKNTNIRDLTVAGGYSARTGGDTISNTNGWSFTIDQDTQYGVGAPTFGATTAGSFGSITQTAASGGDIFIDGTKCWLIPFNTGSGTLTPTAAGVTISGATCVTQSVYTALNAAPATTGASGWLKVVNVSGTLPSSGSYTSDGFSYTITGAAVQGWIEVVGDDAGTMTLVRLGKLQMRGAYYEIGTTDGNRATTYQVPNNGKQLYIPRIEVQGAQWTITGATYSGGFITYTTSAPHDMLVGQPVTVTSVTPSAFNCADQYITDLTDTTFTVAASDPGASYTSGGTAQAYEQYPCAGTLTCTAANWVANEDTRRGKVFWNTNSTTSLTLPTGVIRFGHDGTNSAGAFCPPSGRKIRIGNVFFTNCTTGARNQNVLPHATLGTRYDFTTTGAGRVDIDKASICWYPSIAQAYEVTITNTGIMSQISISEVPTQIVLKNVCIGQEAAVTAVSPVLTSLNTGGTLMHNVVGTQAATTGTGGASIFILQTSSGCEIIDCVGWVYAFRTGTSKYNNFVTLPNLNLTRFHSIGLYMNIVNCADMIVKDTKYTDTTGARSSSQAMYILYPSGPLTSGTIDGLKFVGSRAQNWLTLIAANTGGLRLPLKIRNFGTYANPLAVGDGPYYDKSWSRTTTTCTVTHTAHGLAVNDRVVVFWVTSTSAITIGDKAVTAVPTADTFQFACTNGGDSSGTLSYYFCLPNGLIGSAGGVNCENLTFQRSCLSLAPRIANVAQMDNSNSRIGFENIFAKFDPMRNWTSNFAPLNCYSKQSLSITGVGGASIYGTSFCDGYWGALPDVETCNWTRSGATVTLTTTSGYHNGDMTNNRAVLIESSSDEAALNNGYYTMASAATAGPNANVMRLTGYNTGGSSGTADMTFPTGVVALYMNEGTAENTHYTITSGSPSFTGSGLLRMPTVGDQIVFETPYWIKGHTAFAKMVPTMNTATIANFWIEYQIDTGSGYSGWKTAFRQTATAVADGTAGAATIVQVAAGDSWIADGDYVQTTTWGEVNRAAVVSSGGGTTTLTMNKNHNTTFSNRALQVFRLPAEVIDAEVGFKLKVRITTLIAGTASTNTVGPVQFNTLTTHDSRQVQLPLDTLTLTLTGLVAGSDVTILAAGTETVRATQEENAGTTYAYTYETPESIDIAVYNPGYIPFFIRGYSLGSTNSSVPCAQVADASYLT